MGKRIIIYPGVYEPAEDSYLLIDAIMPIASGDILDLCCGTGIVGLCVADKVRSVTSIDINPIAIKNTCENFKINSVYDKLNAIVGDLFNPLGKVKFDLITMNPPYLWDEEPKDISWSGGKKGRNIIDRFIMSVSNFLKENGKALFVQSTINDIEESLELISKMGLKGKIIMRKKFLFEEIVVIEITY
ncbi:MAG: methyltransferase [Candidatus Verstraetearchaeota archaeon]|jgi:release factor glutamine methyltransferase|nr:methyltransferase [Candidatus Verstraetearchaeota archaeon]